MEARIARLESDMGHMRVDMADVKSELRTLRDRTEMFAIRVYEKFEQLESKLEAKLDGRIGQVDARVDARFDQVDARFAQVDARFAQVDARFDQVDARFDRVDERIDKVEDRIVELRNDLGSAKIWALVLYIAMASAMLGTMARGFGWL